MVSNSCYPLTHLLTYLLIGTSAHSRDGKGNTAIIIAAGRGMVDVMQALLKYGANPEDMSNGGLFDGKTALCWAASQGMMA